MAFDACLWTLASVVEVMLLSGLIRREEAAEGKEHSTVQIVMW
jgi:hypothetical protein